MSRDTGYFRNKYQIGLTIHPDTDTDSVPLPEECYASDVDESDAEFVRDTFGLSEGSSDAVLCCPGCFTPICYKCRINSFGHFESNEAVNVTVESGVTEDTDTPPESLSDTVYTAKRGPGDLHTASADCTARCDECRTVVAVVDDQGVYKFRCVIASRP
uniref:E2f-associated phosphoprotein n=1 Tax=Babesia bovis TaxID=5865 RepID=S6AZK0_BABBO|nr:e2f-associated phosphoprotein [Babesia bovis]